MRRALDLATAAVVVGAAAYTLARLIVDGRARTRVPARRVLSWTEVEAALGGELAPWQRSYVDAVLNDRGLAPRGRRF